LIDEKRSAKLKALEKIMRNSTSSGLCVDVAGSERFENSRLQFFPEFLRHLPDGVVVAAIPHPLAAALAGDEAGIGEDFHVVGDGGLRKLDAGFDIASAEAGGFPDGALALFAEHLQDAAASGIGNGAQLFRKMMTVSVLGIHEHQYSFAARGFNMKKSAPRRAFPKQKITYFLRMGL
jgi:hypothetical protein